MWFPGVPRHGRPTAGRPPRSRRPTAGRPPRIAWTGTVGSQPRLGPPPPEQQWRGIDQGRFDHQPFNYNGLWVRPVPAGNGAGWGFWFLGQWIPL